MKNEAIKEHHLYNKTFARGARFVGRLVSIHVLKDYAAKKRMLAHPMKKYTNRIGLSVTKKIGGAVVRNRAKRIIRAGLFDLQKTHTLKTGYLIVISARSAIVGKKTQDVANDIRAAFTRIGFYADEAQTENRS
jgi:ribonuclease P protein component